MSIPMRTIVRLPPEKSKLFKEASEVKERITIKSDVWPGLENTRTWVEGRVKYWSRTKGWGVVVDSSETEVDARNACEYYVHWRDIAGLNVPWLEKDARVVFEAVEEDSDNRLQHAIARTHHFDHCRPVFRKKDSNQVRAINVHQLNRVNWPEDSRYFAPKTHSDKFGSLSANPRDACDATDDVCAAVDKLRIDEHVSADVQESVDARKAVRLTGKSGQKSTAVPKTVAEMDAAEREHYEREKSQTFRKYPYDFEKPSDLRSRDLAKYRHWFPDLYLKHRHEMTKNKPLTST